MILNNFNLLENIICPNSEDDFWFGQIIARRKDIPDLNRADKLIKSYYIKDFKHLKSKEDEIIKLCNLFHARFYLNPNKRSFKKVSLFLLKVISETVISEQYNCIPNKLDSVCGGIKSSEKIWIIDIDDKNYEIYSLSLLLSLLKPVGDKHILTIPTLNGYHLLVKPFNIKELEPYMDQYKIYAEDIKKNSPTLIYFNNDLSEE